MEFSGYVRVIWTLGSLCVMASLDNLIMSRGIHPPPPPSKSMRSYQRENSTLVSQPFIDLTSAARDKKLLKRMELQNTRLSWRNNVVFIDFHISCT